MPYWVTVRGVREVPRSYPVRYRYHSRPDCVALAGRDVRKVPSAYARKKSSRPCSLCCPQEYAKFLRAFVG